MTNSQFHFKLSQEVTILLFDGPHDKQNFFMVFPNTKQNTQEDILIPKVQSNL